MCFLFVVYKFSVTKLYAIIVLLKSKLNFSEIKNIFKILLLKKSSSLRELKPVF